MKIEHFALNVADPAAMADWYGTHLGMKIARRGDPKTTTLFIADDNGLMIELYNDPREPHFDGASMGTQIWHLALLATDMAADHKRLIAAGCRPVGEINTTAVGDQLAFLRDPWGFVLQLVKRAK